MHVSASSAMMSPGQIDAYRKRTSQIKMCNVVWPTFRCSKCHHYKPNKGRKNVNGRWVCADCYGVV